MKVIIWSCKFCKDIVVSHARSHHTLDECKCGDSFMDLEDYCCRQTDLKILKELDDDDYAIGLELTVCYNHQFDEYEMLSEEDQIWELRLHGENRKYIPERYGKMLKKLKDDIFKQLGGKTW